VVPISAGAARISPGLASETSVDPSQNSCFRGAPAGPAAPAQKRARLLYPRAGQSIGHSTNTHTHTQTQQQLLVSFC